MRATLVAATNNEINITTEWLRTNKIDTDLLVTGLGSAITAYSLTKHIINRRPQLVIQAGIGGTFTNKLPPGSLAFVEREVFADLGALDKDRLADIFDLGLASANEEPFTNKWLINPNINYWKKYNLPFVKSATINAISSNSSQVKRIIEKYNPDIEAMEGAALHFVCLKENVPFIQLRAISNYVGERNKSEWKMKEAIEVLNNTLKKIFEDF